MGLLGSSKLKEFLKPIGNQNQEYFYSNKKGEQSSKFLFNKNRINSNDLEEQRFTTISSFFPNQYLNPASKAEGKPPHADNLFREPNAFNLKNQNPSPQMSSISQQGRNEKGQFGGFAFFSTPYNNPHSKNLAIPGSTANRNNMSTNSNGGVGFGTDKEQDPNAPKNKGKKSETKGAGGFPKFRGSFSQNLDQMPDTPVFKTGDTKTGNLNVLLGKRAVVGDDTDKDKNNDISFQYFAFSKGATQVDKVGNVKEVPKKKSGKNIILKLANCEMTRKLICR